jgi:hypothetical protein
MPINSSVMLNWGGGSDGGTEIGGGSNTTVRRYL